MFPFFFLSDGFRAGQDPGVLASVFRRAPDVRLPGVGPDIGMCPVHHGDALAGAVGALVYDEELLYASCAFSSTSKQQFRLAGVH